MSRCPGLMSVFCSAADTAGEFDDTISQAVRAFGLRQCRYIGLAKTKLQHVVTVLAINIVRMDAWLTERPLAKTRRSAFASLQPMRV